MLREQDIAHPGHEGSGRALAGLFGRRDHFCKEGGDFLLGLCPRPRRFFVIFLAVTRVSPRGTK